MALLSSFKFAPLRPTVFIGSSTKGLPIARKLSGLLARAARCRVWDRGVFGIGMGTLEALVKATREHDFAILVLTADDLSNKKGLHLFLPRDNVVFELGLFMGALGKDRTFIVLKKQKGQISLPSDLDGITRADTTGKDLKVACDKIRQAMASATSRIDLTGRWYSAYQTHDKPVGRWITDTTEVRSRPPARLRFKGSTYEAIGEFSVDTEIIGVWRQTQSGASARGTFHLYVDRFGYKLYGVCTGPTSQGQNVYSGWVMVRDEKKLLEGQRELSKAMLVSRSRSLV